MMRWEPDTCDCVIEETHNPSDPTYGVKFNRVITKCPAHQAIPDIDLYSVIQTNPDSEQKRKNLLETELLADDVVGVGGSLDRRYKDGVKYKWSFDTNRILNVTIEGAVLTLPSKALLRTFCDNRFGSGKVVIS